MFQDVLSKAITLRHELHSHPELSNHEIWTKKHLIEFIKTNTSLEVVDMGKWFYACYFAGEKKDCIAFRADFDAVPVNETLNIPYCSKFQGVAHKCGHDGHSATLAALAMQVEIMKPDKNIYFIFQHAEETGDGAKCCASLIAEKNIREVYAFHNYPGAPLNTVAIKSGTLCCASKGMEIIFHGISAHASEPEKGINPSFAIANIINHIPTLTAPNKHDGLVLCTVVGVDIGERAFGVSAHEGNLLLTIRAEKEEELNELQHQLELFSKYQAETYGLKYEMKYYDAFPETYNHNESVDKITSTCKSLGLPVSNMASPLRTSEDFGYFTKCTKGAMFWLGDGEDYPPLHSTTFDFPDSHIETASKIFLELIMQDCKVPILV